MLIGCRGVPEASEVLRADARVVLILVSTTVETVIAIVLGLTVVALQLASTHFSLRLLLEMHSEDDSRGRR
jgi:uncharacterized membrane protein